MNEAQTFRAFIAIEPPTAIRAALHIRIRDLAERDSDQSMRWVSEDGIHLTVAFLGQLAEAAAPRLIRALTEALANRRPFTLRVTGLGAFPDGRRRQGSRVIWAGLESETDALLRLHTSVLGALSKAGLHIAGHSFTPHITLGRVRRGKHFSLDAQRLPAAGAGQEFLVTGVSLMESRLSRGPAIYVRRGLAALAG